MDKIRLALVGCGGMGTRHLYGLRELARSPFDNVELAALCDISLENAEMAAGEAEQLLGKRPPIYADLEEMARQTPDLDAVDVVLDPSLHHGVVCQALNLGLHVLVEKPMAITVRGCLQMMAAAERNDRLISVAENYRRDPSARLVHHLLRKGAIGTPYMALFHSQSATDEIFITPWRHLKERGGPVVDLGVHFADLIRYQLGEVAEVYADVRLVHEVRKKPEERPQQYEFYRKRAQAMSPEVPATAEDSSLALLKMESGATVSWMVGAGGYGSSHCELILGDRGSIQGLGTRGGSVRMVGADRQEIGHEDMLAATELQLEPLATHFFPSAITRGDAAVDWKLIAMEYFELAEGILHGREIEVDGTEGMKDVAATYAIFESARAGRTVTMDEVETCQVYEYQQEIDDALEGV